MDGFTIPTACGRSVLVRTCVGGGAIQVGIIGRRGGMVEAFSLDATQLSSFMGCLEQAGSEANAYLADLEDANHADLLDRLAEAERQAKSDRCLNGHHLDRENTYKSADGRRHCRICRRERVKKKRRERGLA